MLETGGTAKCPDAVFLTGEIAAATAKINIDLPQLIIYFSGSQPKCEKTIRIKIHLDRPVTAADPRDFPNARNRCQFAGDNLIDKI